MFIKLKPLQRGKLTLSPIDKNLCKRTPHPHVLSCLTNIRHINFFKKIKIINTSIIIESKISPISHFCNTCNTLKNKLLTKYEL